LYGHPYESKRIDDPNLRETLKELAQLDGAFVVSDEGVVLSAARYIDAVSNHLVVPLGLGSRHVAAASVSSRTDAVAVSENSTESSSRRSSRSSGYWVGMVRTSMVPTLMARAWLAKPDEPLCKNNVNTTSLPSSTTRASCPNCQSGTSGLPVQ
jgi:hypothetical protein